MRKATDTTKYIGHCPACFNRQKVRKGKMVLHGYKRPGDGWINGRCYGVGHQPFELSTEGTLHYLQMLQDNLIPDARQELAKLESHPLWIEFIRLDQEADAMRKNNTWDYGSELGKQRRAAREACCDEIVQTYWDRGHKREVDLWDRIYGLKNYISSSQSEVETLLQRVEQWTLDTLTEAK